MEYSVLNENDKKLLNDLLRRTKNIPLNRHPGDEEEPPPSLDIYVAYGKQIAGSCECGTDQDDNTGTGTGTGTAPSGIGDPVLHPGYADMWIYRIRAPGLDQGETTGTGTGPGCNDCDETYRLESVYQVKQRVYNISPCPARGPFHVVVRDNYGRFITCDPANMSWGITIALGAGDTGTGSGSGANRLYPGMSSADINTNYLGNGDQPLVEFGNGPIYRVRLGVLPYYQHADNHTLHEADESVWVGLASPNNSIQNKGSGFGGVHFSTDEEQGVTQNYIQAASMIGYLYEGSHVLCVRVGTYWYIIGPLALMYSQCSIVQMDGGYPEQGGSLTSQQKGTYRLSARGAGGGVYGTGQGGSIFYDIEVLPVTQYNDWGFQINRPGDYLFLTNIGFKPWNYNQMTGSTNTNEGMVATTFTTGGPTGGVTAHTHQVVVQIPDFRSWEVEAFIETTNSYTGATNAYLLGGVNLDYWVKTTTRLQASRVIALNAGTQFRLIFRNSFTNLYPNSGSPGYLSDRGFEVSIATDATGLVFPPSLQIIRLGAPQSIPY